jgi:hypothetical protein
MNELKSLLNLCKEIVQKVLHVAQQFEKLKLERNNFKNVNKRDEGALLIVSI